MIVGKATEWYKQINKARLDHTLTLLLLCPTIQTEIICGDNKILSLIPEYKMRDLAAQFDWNKQAEAWQSLKEHLSRN